MLLTTAARNLPQSPCSRPSHSRYPFLRPPFTVLSWCELLYAWWMLGGQRCVTYQCALPCFNTEQMNGLHAISLKEEDSTACEGVGVCCVSACGGGRRAFSSTDRAPSYVEDLIHVTGGCCHSAARRHLTRCQFQVIKRAYGRCTEWRTPPPCLPGSGLCQELCVGGGTRETDSLLPNQNTTSAQRGRHTKAGAHAAAAKQQASTLHQGSDPTGN